MSLYRKWIGGPGDLVAKYTSSLKDDSEIAEEVVKVLKAHVAHLAETGAAPSEAAQAILKALDEADPQQLLAGDAEDVHEAVEKWLVDRLGPETAGWAGLARSRNDHVAAAIRLAALKKTEEIVRAAHDAVCALAQKALEHAECAMPSFTHFQPAQVVTYGHYLMAIAELVQEYLHALEAVKDLLRRSPLGAGPAGGVKTPLDRERLARLAGFSTIVENSLYASGGRFFALALASATTSLLVELSRAVDDFIRWASPQIGYLHPPPRHVSTSSIMPHKKNLVTLEVLRARAGEAAGHLAAMYAAVSKIGLAYSLDLQEATRHLWAVLKIAKEGLEVLADFVRGAAVDCEKSRRDAQLYYTTSSDTAETAALAGTPFRTAYFQLAEKIRQGEAELLPVEEALKRPTAGSANPQKVREAAGRLLPSCTPRPL